MARSTMVERVESLEKTIESLRELPASTDRLESRVGSVEVQILQLRQDMRDEFSELKQLVHEGDETTRAELRSEMRALNDQTHRHMLVLHEDLIQQITPTTYADPDRSEGYQPSRISARRGFR